jgi:hypothetical protein
MSTDRLGDRLGFWPKVNELASLMRLAVGNAEGGT